jgi:hypothetical protein
MVGYVSTLQKTLALGKRDKTLKKSRLAVCPDWRCATPVCKLREPILAPEPEGLLISDSFGD